MVSSKSETTKFSSEGFDLDALAAVIPEGAAEIVYELGGKVSAKETEQSAKLNDQREKQRQDESEQGNTTVEDDNHPLRMAEQYKQLGNEAFMKQEWQNAWDLYTQAIDAVPYDSDKRIIYTGDRLMELQNEWEKEQGRIARQKLHDQEERERLKRQRQRERQKKGDTAGGSTVDDESDDDDDNKANVKKDDEPRPHFQPPPHPFSEQLAVYYSNRAAAMLYLEQLTTKASSNTASPTPPNSTSSSFDGYDDDSKRKKNPQLENVIRDCTIAILFKPNYVKALVRRATAYERLEQTDRALDDTKQAVDIMKVNGETKSPQYKNVTQSVVRLQRLEDERLEKLKTETLDKLKDLGNSILGNFGLSLDSFQAKQDPNTGSYSISFNNGAK